jgi:hypothetical protein
MDPTRIIIHLPEGREFASYDFTKGTAAAAYQGLCAAGAPCTSTYDGILRLLSPNLNGDETHETRNTN